MLSFLFIYKTGREQMKQDIWNYIWFFAAIPLLLRFLDFSSSGNPSYLIIGSWGILLVVLIFRNYKLFNKIFPLILIGLILFSLLILSYTYLFQPIYVSSFGYYYAIVGFLGYVSIFVYYYLNQNSKY